ncbi:recombinase family protein [Neisseria sicca]|uniref:recombinase family protein n=1 Tax=Neisseria sicca TaxID=490 RepID=UPI001F3A249F|nr:recombinase family protein [Neisseria sicca]
MSEINKIARIYCRVSTEEQDLSRQLGLKQWAESRGFYVAKIYAEKASGRHADRPQLLEMIKDLQAGEIVIAESMERLSRLPLAEAEALIAQINNRGARLLLPEVLDLPAVKAAEDSMEGVVCGRGRNPTLRLWPAIFSGEIDVFPSERRNMGQEIGR